MRDLFSSVIVEFCVAGGVGDAAKCSAHACSKAAAEPWNISTCKKICKACQLSLSVDAGIDGWRWRTEECSPEAPDSASTVAVCAGVDAAVSRSRGRVQKEASQLMSRGVGTKLLFLLFVGLFFAI